MSLCPIFAANTNIHQMLAGAHLSDDAVDKSRAPSAHCGQSNIGKLLLKNLQDFVEIAALPEIHRDRSFFTG